MVLLANFWPPGSTDAPTAAPGSGHARGFDVLCSEIGRPIVKRMKQSLECCFLDLWCIVMLVGLLLMGLRDGHEPHVASRSVETIKMS